MGEIEKSSKLITPYGFLLGYILLSVRCVLEAYGVLFDLDLSHLELGGTNIFMILAFLVAFVSAMWWIVKMSQNSDHVIRCSDKLLNDEKYQLYVYIFIGVLVSISVVVCNAVFGASTWPNVTEANLISYVYIQFAANVLMTGTFKLL